MHPKCKPKRARPPQREAPENPDHHDACDSRPAFTRVGNMHRSKNQRCHNRRRPEPESLRQRKLYVPAKRIFLKKSHDYKEHNPEDRPLHEVGAVNIERAKAVIPGSRQHSDDSANLDDPERGTLKKQLPQPRTPRQPVLTRSSLL